MRGAMVPPPRARYRHGTPPSLSPHIHHHSSESDEPFDVARHEKALDGLSSEEASKALATFMKNKGGLFLRFKQGNMKEGQN